MWSRTWQWACREEHIPEPGDYYVYDVGDRSAVVVRGPDGSIKAFHNACLHRGTQLKPPASMGYSPKLRCPFHGWRFDANDGKCAEIPYCEEIPERARLRTGLRHYPRGRLLTWLFRELSMEWRAPLFIPNGTYPRAWLWITLAAIAASALAVWAYSYREEPVRGNP